MLNSLQEVVLRVMTGVDRELRRTSPGGATAQPLYRFTDNASNVILDADYRRRFLQTTEQQEHVDAA
ncbi:MAG: hypothetical protein NTX27_04510 [Verrucomicrobia bacterium]|nr:hypothetical protein [Verrucomicrobiota bacterium]